MVAKSRSTSPRGRLLVGSSMRTTRARAAIARQISTTCRAPIGRRPTVRVGVDLGVAELGEHVAGEAAGLRAIPDAAARGLGAHEDVLGHGQVGEERQLLVDEGDAAVARVPRANGA